MANNIEQFKTKLKISDSKHCEECPLKLFVGIDDYIELGIGNIYSDIIFVLPSYFHTSNKQLLDALIKCYESINGRNLLEDAYITRLCKCYCKSIPNINDESIKYCNNFLNYEIDTIRPKHIVYFGKVYDYFCNYAKSIVNYSESHFLPNPICLIYDNDKLKEHFIKLFKHTIINII